MKHGFLCPVVGVLWQVNYSHGNVHAKVSKDLFTTKTNTIALLGNIHLRIFDDGVHQLIGKEKTKKVSRAITILSFSRWSTYNIEHRRRRNGQN